MRVRPALALLPLLLAGCGPAHDAAGLREEEVALATHWAGIRFTGSASRLLDDGVDALPDLLPYVAEEARLDAGVRYRSVALAILVNAVPQETRAHGAQDTGVRVTSLDPRSLAVIAQALRTRSADLRRYARYVLGAVADARLFAAAIDDLGRAVSVVTGEQRSVGPPEEVKDSCLAMQNLGIENGALVRAPGQSQGAPGDPAFSPPWMSVFSGQLWSPWDAPSAARAVADLRAWLASRAADLPPQVTAD